MNSHKYSEEEFAADPEEQISLPLGFFRTAWALQASRIIGYRKMIDRLRDEGDDPMEDYDPGYALTTLEPYEALHKMRVISEEIEASRLSDSNDHLMYPHLSPAYPFVALIGRSGGFNAHLYDMFNRGREHFRSLPAYLADAFRVDVADEIMDISPILPVFPRVQDTDVVINF